MLIIMNNQNYQIKLIINQLKKFVKCWIIFFRISPHSSKANTPDGKYTEELMEIMTCDLMRINDSDEGKVTDSHYGAKYWHKFVSS
jgi:hypothetical protein